MLVSCGGDTTSIASTGPTGNGASGGSAAGTGGGGVGGAGTASGGGGSGGNRASDDSGVKDAATDGSTCPLGPSDAGVPTCAPDSVITSSLNACGDPRENASRVVAGMSAGFRNCYNRALAQNPGVYGVVTLFIRLGSGGEVSGVRATTEGTLPDSVVGCIKARASAAQFDPAAGSTTLVFVITAGCAPSADAMP